MAYAAGLTLLLGTQPVVASILSGRVREEAVLAGELGQSLTKVQLRPPLGQQGYDVNQAH